jgi:CheY-like chemotaxis protein
LHLTRRVLGLVTALVVACLPGVSRGQDKLDQELQEKVAIKRRLEKAEDEYRVFLQKPEQPHQFWAAMKVEMALGKFELAALHMNQLLAREPREETDKELVRIENVEGMSSFLRLRGVRQWSEYKPFQEQAEKDVEELMERLTKALHTYLSDPKRLNKFIKQLDAETPEERLFAFAQLNRAREYAVPYLIEALQVNFGNRLYTKIVQAMLHLDSAIVPVFLEALKAHDARDAGNADLRSTLLDIVRIRQDVRAVPYLWHVSAAKIYPPALQARALQTLASLLKTDALLLPPAKVGLTRLAEDYYQHKVRFAAGAIVRVWPWDGQKLELKPVELTPHQAEEFFGTRAAREALDLDSGYVPAQQVLLSLVLERAFEDNLDKFILAPMPQGVRTLLASVDSDLVMSVLERGLDEHRLAVVLPAAFALGERGETRAARLNAGGQPRGLVRALYYPDRRVQFVAALSLIRMPGTPAPAVSTRLVDVLRRFLTGDATPDVLAAYVPPDKADDVRQGLKGAGFDFTPARHIQEGMSKLQSSADFDLIILHQALPQADLPHVLTQLRADPDHGLLPILVVPHRDAMESAQKVARRHRNVMVMPEVILTMPDELKKTLETQVKETQGAKLSAEERQKLPRIALDVLWRMSRGELAGYDVRPAMESLWTAVRTPEMAAQALEALGRLPGGEVQRRLAAIAADAGAKEEMRVPAAYELNRHIQRNGLLLDKRQLGDVRTAYQGAVEPNLKAQLAIALGATRPTAQQTGTQLFQFRPDPPAAAAEKKEEK